MSSPKSKSAWNRRPMQAIGAYPTWQRAPGGLRGTVRGTNPGADRMRTHPRSLFIVPFCPALPCLGWETADSRFAAFLRHHLCLALSLSFARSHSRLLACAPALPAAAPLPLGLCFSCAGLHLRWTALALLHHAALALSFALASDAVVTENCWCFASPDVRVLRSGRFVSSADRGLGD